MLRSASQLTSYSIQATDANLGQVKDLLFDDRVWIVRYLVADTGTWLPGRRVLIPPTELAQPDWQTRLLPVTLTREEVEKSPGISEDEPVSRRREIDLFRYHGWPPYWTGLEATAYAENVARVSAAKAAAGPETEGDPDLRSMKEVLGYHIAARDGDLGHVEDLILDDETWHIRWVAIDTRNWWPGKKVIVSPQWIERVSWSDRKVTVDLTREQIKKSPEYDPSAPVNREYEARLYDFYGRPYYWS